MILSAILGGYFPYKTHLKFFIWIVPNLCVYLSIFLNANYLLSLVKFLKLILNSFICGLYRLDVKLNELFISFFCAMSLADIDALGFSSNLNVCFFILLIFLNLSLVDSFNTIWSNVGF